MSDLKRKERDSCSKCGELNRPCDGLFPDCEYYRRAAGPTASGPHSQRTQSELEQLEQQIQQLERKLQTLTKRESAGVTLAEEVNWNVVDPRDEIAIDDVHDDITTPLPRPPSEYETNDVRAVDVERLSDIFDSSTGRGTERRPDTIFASQLKGITLIGRARAANASPRTDRWERINTAIQLFMKGLFQTHPSLNSGLATQEPPSVGLVTAAAAGYTAAIFLNADLSLAEPNVQQDRVMWAKSMVTMMVGLSLEEAIKACAMFGYSLGKAAEVLILHKKVALARGMSGADVDECIARVLGAIKNLTITFPALTFQVYHVQRLIRVWLGNSGWRLDCGCEDAAPWDRRTTFLPGLLESTQVCLLFVYDINYFYIPRDTSREMNVRSSPAPANEPIQAYYKLSFPNFEYYLQTLSVTIGRRPRPLKHDGDIEAIPIPTPPVKTEIIRDAAGPSMTNVHSQERSTAKEDDANALLQLAEAAEGTKIQISSRTFYFVLPPPAVSESPLTPETTPEADAIPTAAEDCATNDDVSPKPNKHAASRSPSPVPPKKRRLKPPRSPIKSPPRAPPDAQPPSSRSRRRRSASSSSSSSSSRKISSQTHPLLQEPMEPDEESEGDELVSIGDLEQDELNELRVLDESGNGSKEVSGKGSQKAGKGVRRRGGTSSKGPPGLKTTSQPSSEQPSTSPTQLPLIRPLPAKLAKELLKQSMPPSDPSAPKQPKRYMTQRLIQKTQLAQLPRPPPDKMPPKPPFTYAILCFRAIQELGGKASLSEIVNWIRDTHEWYRWNDECGWESSVRHNLSSNPGFMKGRRDADVERIQATTGQPKKTKGFFWSVDPKAADSFLEKEREIIEAGSRAKAQQKAKAAQQAGLADPTASLGASTGMNLAGLPASALPAVPVPMMAPRGAGPPPPVGMSMTPSLHPHPHILPPPPMMPLPTSAPLPTIHSSLTIAPNPSPVPHAPGSSAAAPSAAFPQALPDVCLSITVGPPPPGADTDTFSSPYVDGPPITLRNGALFLNPTIFSGLSQEQLDDLQKLKAQAALEILMTYTKNYVKEQIVKKGKAKAKAKASPSGSGNGASAKSNDSTKTGEVPNQPQPASPELATTSSGLPTPQFDAASVLAVANLASASATSSISPPPPPSISSPGAHIHAPPMPSHSASPPLAGTGQPVSVYSGLGSVPQPGQPPHPYAYYPYQPPGSWAYPKPAAGGPYHYPSVPHPSPMPNQALQAYSQHFPHYPPPMRLPQSPPSVGHAPPGDSGSSTL
ncbi:Pre-rRNA-processing protein fhl1 [Tulasnella sp. 417]|nr:Pre-rRNA-processing protein fhl1 [Tulasnella sp. 417]